MKTNTTPQICRFVTQLTAMAAALVVAAPSPVLMRPAQAQNYTQRKSGYASRPSQTLMSINLSGSATVYINGRSVGAFSETLTKRDVSRFVRRGENTLRIVLKPGSNFSIGNIDRFPNGFVKIAHAYRTNEFKDLTKISFGASLPGRTHKHDYSSTFTFDGLTPGATGAREASGREAPTRYGYGYSSRPNQTIISLNVTGDISIFVNGRKVETFSDAVLKRDISRFVRRGSNSITVRLHPGTSSGAGSRDGVPVGYVRIAHALRQNQFKTLNTIYFGPAARGKQHQMEYQATFTADS